MAHRDLGHSETTVRLKRHSGCVCTQPAADMILAQGWVDVPKEEDKAEEVPGTVNPL